jgi:hypothetical protein
LQYGFRSFLSYNNYYYLSTVAGIIIRRLGGRWKSKGGSHLGAADEEAIIGTVWLMTAEKGIVSNHLVLYSMSALLTVSVARVHSARRYR